MIIEEVQN